MAVHVIPFTLELIFVFFQQFDLKDILCFCAFETLNKMENISTFGLNLHLFW